MIINNINLIKGLVIILIVPFLIMSCGGKTSVKESGVVVEQQYSKGFSITDYNNKKVITIYNPKNKANILGQFTLLPEDYSGKLKANEIKVPCKRIICLSSTQLAYIIELDAIDNVAGINSSRHLFNKTVKAKVEQGTILKVGKEGVFNTEVIAAINPDVIFVSPFKSGGYDALRNLGIPLVPMAAYSEQLPLGRAEWIKFMSVFVDREHKADSLFNTVADRYNELKRLTATVQNRPTVLSGKMKGGGSWYVAGGDSFFAHMFTDAGADYIVKNNKSAAVPMDYESVYAMGHDADYWRLLTSSPEGFNKRTLEAEDQRYTDFKAYKTGNILVCNLREVPYREESCIKPHILLADYIHHFHSNLLPDYKPKYWTKIDE
ncbi:MAG: ABC transporter substrate-binding protein [Bacteroidales bacterium]|nr:ABC transporter substrate-binding protein [Bacteroidales bacterium]